MRHRLTVTRTTTTSQVHARSVDEAVRRRLAHLWGAGIAATCLAVPGGQEIHYTDHDGARIVLSFLEEA